MKKIFTLFITILLCLSLSSCKDKTCVEDPTQEKCQPAELTCEDDPSQEKCQPPELTCDEDPNQEKCAKNKVACKEDPDQEKCNDSIYGDINYIKINLDGMMYNTLTLDTIEDITMFLNEFRFLDVELVESEEKIISYDNFDIRIDYKDYAFEDFQSFSVTPNGMVTNVRLNYYEYSDEAVIDYDKLFDYLDQNGEMVNTFPDPETFTMGDLDKVLQHLNSLEKRTAISVSMSNSWASTNKSLINCIVREIEKVNFVEKLTKYNKKDFSSSLHVPWISIYLAGPKYVKIEVTNTGYVYLTYSEFSVSTQSYEIKSQFKSELYDNCTFFEQFMNGYPLGHQYYKEQVVDEYISEDLLSKNKQDFIIKNFIFQYADLALYYQKDQKFSGSIKEYYGEFGKYNDNNDTLSVIMAECSEMIFEQGNYVEVIDGVNFEYQDTNRIYCHYAYLYTLQEAFDYGYLTHADLVEISKIHNQNKQ